jgi:hypothetical protein
MISFICNTTILVLELIKTLHVSNQSFVSINVCGEGMKYADDFIIKNVPKHILAPSAVACDIIPLRVSARPPEGFYDMGNKVSYITRKERDKCRFLL